MRNPGGYLVQQGPIGVAKESDTFTCFHCNRVVEVYPLQPPEDIGGLCKVCMKLVCAHCHAQGSCTPWEEKMKKMEARDAFRRSLGI